jgi:hypothetical protein
LPANGARRAHALNWVGVVIGGLAIDGGSRGAQVPRPRRLVISAARAKKTMDLCWTIETLDNANDLSRSAAI